MHKIPVGVSSCLLGENVRYDGGHRYNSLLAKQLGEYFEFVYFCPEVGIGLGIPRPPIQLVLVEKHIRCQGVADPKQDVTLSLQHYAKKLKPKHDELRGYIFKKGSPSCGARNVKIYQDQRPISLGIGIYAQTIMQLHPLLPVIDEQCLENKQFRENFIIRATLLHQWKKLIHQGLSVNRLIDFDKHANQNELSCSIDCQAILLGLNNYNLSSKAEQYIHFLFEQLPTFPKETHNK